MASNGIIKAMKYKIALTDPHQHQFDSTLLKTIAAADAYLEAKRCQSDEDVVSLCADADVIMTSSAKIRRQAIAKCPKCRVIVRIGAGYDNVDDTAAGEMGMPVTNVPDFCTEEVAAHTMTLLLAHVRKVIKMSTDTRDGVWEPNSILPVPRLSILTLGIVGFGLIGRAVAKRAASFDMKLLYFDPFYSPSGKEFGAQRCANMGDLLGQADCVSLHVPLIAQTQELIGEKELRSMKPSAVLINTSRGAVVDEKALISALREGIIAGACLDVLDPEPPQPDNPLLTMNNVIVTPHCASHSTESFAELRRRAVEEAIRAIKGQELVSIVNTAILEQNDFSLKLPRVSS